jgi:SAM-dependent methyltransferase
MASRQFARQQERLADYLRRFGLEGEAAFRCLAYQYVLTYPQKLTNLPPEVIQKWRQVYGKLQLASRSVGLLPELVGADPAGDNLPDWYQFFVGRRYREGSGKFFTPQPIAATMARLLPKRPGAVIMDPTCGGGTFLVEAARYWEGSDCTLVANDVESSLVELAILALSLGVAPQQHPHFSAVNIFDSTPELAKWSGQVDYILANPPFSLQIEQEQFDSPLFLVGYHNSDALFIDTARKLLKPGGRLVCLLPHSIVANQEFARLRATIEQDWVMRGVICLPEGVFHLNSGTITRADIVILEKKPLSGEGQGRLIFASLPSAGVRLNGQASIVAHELQNLLANTQVRAVLGL